MDKIKVFEKELNFIKNSEIKNFAVKATEKIPDYFFKIPASSTGKYHPAYAIQENGLVLHTKAAIRIAIDLFRLEMFNNYNDDIKDLIIVSLLLHDSRKNGDKYSKYTRTEHPTIAKNSIQNDPELNTLLKQKQLDVVLSGIESHMGQWNYDYRSKKEILPKPKIGYQNFIHLCDYLASRKSLEFNFDIDINRE